MKRFKEMAVATDLSDESLQLISYAHEIVSGNDGHLTVVHVVPSMSLADDRHSASMHDIDLVDAELLEHARSSLESWVRDNLENSEAVELVVSHGDIDEVICHAAKDCDADVLLVAPRGRSGLDRLALSSISRRLMRNAPCPVLVVNPPEANGATRGEARRVDMKTVDHILAPTDLSRESLDVVKYAVHLAQSEGAALTVLHIVGTTSIAYAEFVPSLDLSSIEHELVKASRKKLESWISRNFKDAERLDVRVHFGSPNEVIERIAKEVDAGLVVMATHGYRGFKRAFLGSVTESFVRHSPCPVLVVRPPKHSEPARTAKRKSKK